MQDLTFNTGMIELAIQGDFGRILRFNPADGNVQAGFFTLIDKGNEKMREVAAKENEIIAGAGTDLEKAKQRNRLDLETDAFLRAELDAIFGAGTAETVFGQVCTTATTANGETVFTGFIYALMPFFTKEIQSRNEKIKKIIADHKPPKG